ncbi:MAG: hypothetical protein IKP47_12355 [Ruminococcus sp.]|nr:hypothetical protein [Ruminococcus sp.]
MFLKKITAALIAAAAFMNCLSADVFAVDRAGLTLSLDYAATPVVKGDTVDVTVKMSGNTGLCGWRVLVGYDTKAFEYTGVEFGVFPEEYSFASKVEYKAQPFVLAFENYETGNEITANGVLGKISFKVKDTAPEGSYNFTLSYDPVEFFDREAVSVPVAGTLAPSGSVYVHEHQYTDSFVRPTSNSPGCIRHTCTKCDQFYDEPAYFKGDVNRDGFISVMDYTLLARYLAGWSGFKEQIYMPAAELDENPGATVSDLSVLARYLAGWAGYDTYIVPLPAEEE